MQFIDLNEAYDFKLNEITTDFNDELTKYYIITETRHISDEFDECAKEITNKYFNEYIKKGIVDDIINDPEIVYEDFSGYCLDEYKPYRERIIKTDDKTHKHPINFYLYCETPKNYIEYAFTVQRSEQDIMNAITNSIKTKWKDDDTIQIYINTFNFSKDRINEYIKNNMYAQIHSLLYSIISHELAHVIQQYRSKKADKLITNNTYIQSYNLLATKDVMHLKTFNQSLFLSEYNLLYMFSKEEMNARETSLKKYLESFIKTNRNQLSDIVKNNLKNFVNDFENVPVMFNKKMLIFAVLQIKDIRDITNIKNIFRIYYDLCRVYPNDVTLPNMQILLISSYYFIKDKTLIKEQPIEILKKYIQPAKIRSYIELSENELSHKIEFDDDLFSLLCTVQKTIKKKYIKYLTNLENIIDEQLPYIFETNMDLPDDVLIHTVLTKEIGLQDIDFDKMKYDKSVFETYFSIAYNSTYERMMGHPLVEVTNEQKDNWGKLKNPLYFRYDYPKFQARMKPF